MFHLLAAVNEGRDGLFLQMEKISLEASTTADLPLDSMSFFDSGLLHQLIQLYSRLDPVPHTLRATPLVYTLFLKMPCNHK